MLCTNRFLYRVTLTSTMTQRSCWKLLHPDIQQRTDIGMTFYSLHSLSFQFISVQIFCGYKHLNNNYHLSHGTCFWRFLFLGDKFVFLIIPPFSVFSQWFGMVHGEFLSSFTRVAVFVRHCIPGYFIRLQFIIGWYFTVRYYRHGVAVPRSARAVAVCWTTTASRRHPSRESRGGVSGRRKIVAVCIRMLQPVARAYGVWGDLFHTYGAISCCSTTVTRLR